jgi:hypothetical protein
MDPKPKAKAENKDPHQALTDLGLNLIARKNDYAVYEAQNPGQMLDALKINGVADARWHPMQKAGVVVVLFSQPEKAKG